MSADTPTRTAARLPVESRGDAMAGGYLDTDSSVLESLGAVVEGLVRERPPATAGEGPTT